MEPDFIHQYFYLWSIALAIPLWVFIVYKKKNSRVEMIYMGIFCGASALALDRYCHFYDYWQPPIIFDAFNFESFLSGFILGGISAKSYELFFNKEHSTRKIPNPLFLLAFTAGSVFLYMLLLGLFQLNSVDIVVCIFLTWTIVFLFIDPSLLKMCIGSGVIMTAVAFCMYTIALAIYPSAIQDIWLTNDLKGIFIFNIPIEEYYFFFSFGCIVSIMYKVATRTDMKWPREITLPERFKVWPARSDRPDRDDIAPGSKPFLPGLIGWLKPFHIPLLLLLLVIGRMVIFGDARIPVGQMFNFFR